MKSLVCVFGLFLSLSAFAGISPNGENDSFPGQEVCGVFHVANSGPWIQDGSPNGIGLPKYGRVFPEGLVPPREGQQICAQGTIFRYDNQLHLVQLTTVVTVPYSGTVCGPYRISTTTHTAKVDDGSQYGVMVTELPAGVAKPANNSYVCVTGVLETQYGQQIFSRIISVDAPNRAAPVADPEEGNSEQAPASEGASAAI